jgi:hypothetical protein
MSSPAAWECSWLAFRSTTTRSSICSPTVGSDQYVKTPIYRWRELRNVLLWNIRQVQFGARVARMAAVLFVDDMFDMAPSSSHRSLRRRLLAEHRFDWATRSGPEPSGNGQEDLCVVFLLRGLVLPCVPRYIFPRRVRMSPFPMDFPPSCGRTNHTDGTRHGQYPYELTQAVQLAA